MHTKPRRLTTMLTFGLATAFIGSAPSSAQDGNASGTDVIKRGEYLATAGDCVACHTGPGGEKFAGGLVLDTPVGKLVTPNITPDKETGIGKWTDDQFYRAMHEGLDDEGSYLYPAFPYPWYTKVTKDDALAIKAYLFSLKPVSKKHEDDKLGFPFNIRTGLITWRTLFFKEGTFKPDPKDSAEVNRGAYLVEGLGHCGECHNKSNLLGASVWSGKLEGGAVEGWYAPNITSDGKQGVGSWANKDIVQYLKTGAKPDGSSVAVGPMKETIAHSTSKLTEADLGAIAAYLKSTAAKETISKNESSKGIPVEAANEHAYLTHCSACHGKDGQGIKGAVPALAGNGAVTAKGAQTVISVVLGGVQAQNGLAPMPAVGQPMSDQEIADAVNYARSAWGNTAPADVGAGEVGTTRQKTKTMLAGQNADACKPVADETLKKAVDTEEVKGKLEKLNLSDILGTIDAILPDVKKAAPSAKPDEITNALLSAYCPIVHAKVPAERRSTALGDFGTLVYGRAKGDGKQASAN